MRTLLVDGDLLLFAAGAAVEYDTQWDAWLWTRHANLDQAIEHFETALADLRTQTEADRTIIALTDETNWRKGVMPSYKAHRTSDKRPVCYKALRQYAHETHEVFQRPTLEGDDVLGILATGKAIDGEKVIWSIDKDLLQIPGLHWRDGEMVTVTKDQGDLLHWMQTLTGDTSDGYPGCPGIGPVKARTFLEGALTEEVWGIIVGCYQKAKLTEADALANARVARICRASDYDFTTKEVKLWSPCAT